MLDIVLIGDSIAKGVGSSDAKTKSYGALIGEKVDGKVTNLGITGLDSGQLIEKLETEKFQEALEDADVIFVSIGSNDLLKPFLSIVAEAADVTGEGKDLYKNLQKQFSKLSKNDPLAAGDALANAVKNVRKSSQLKKACEQFPENLETIITELRESYPEAVIYVNNIYNPYYGVAYVYEGLTLLNIHELCEGYIVELNKAFDYGSKDYSVMDMYSIFRQDGYTNVNPASLQDMSGVNFDPHPNDAGYQLMADYIYTQMDSIAPKVEALIDDTQNVPANLNEIQLQTSEKIRTIAGKRVYLKSDKEEYEYTFTGKEEIKASENGRYILTLPMKEFIGNRTLSYNKQYELILEKEAFKDKGNNSPKQLTVIQFRTEEEPIAQVQSNSVTVVNQSGSKEEGVYTIMWISIAIFVLIAVAIVALVLYNRRKRKVQITTEEFKL